MLSASLRREHDLLQFKKKKKNKRKGPMTKNLYTNKKSKEESDNTKRHQKPRLHNDCRST